jgi:hypothetical protein
MLSLVLCRLVKRRLPVRRLAMRRLSVRRLFNSWLPVRTMTITALAMSALAVLHGPRGTEVGGRMICSMRHSGMYSRMTIPGILGEVTPCILHSTGGRRTSRWIVPLLRLAVSVCGIHRLSAGWM